MRFTGAHRLIPSRYPTVGILESVASPEDLNLIFELEAWSNDRISGELGILRAIPESEWVAGRPMSTVVMAAFCHPNPAGGRFNGPDRGAWYAARSLATAHAEVAFHRSKELAEVGVQDARMEMRLYLANFDADFFDVRPRVPANESYHDPASYTASQQLAARLLEAGSPGVVYRSVRHPGGECIACFRPKAVKNVRAAAHFIYTWKDGNPPSIQRAGSSARLSIG